MPIDTTDVFADDQIPAGSSEKPCCTYSLVCEGDLLAAQYHAVRITSFMALINTPAVSLCGNGQKPLGILQEPGGANDMRLVICEGKSKVVIGQAVTFWQSWQSNALGQLIPLAASSWCGGRFYTSGGLSATPSGLEMVTALIGCHNPWRSDSQFTDEGGR